MASEKTDPRATRRRFLVAVVLGGGAAVGGTLAAIVARFLSGGPVTGSGAAVAVGPVTAFDGTSPVEALLSYSRPDGYRTEDRRERIFLVRHGSEIVALSSTCSHLGCSVRWDGPSGLFRCPCHGGAYRPNGSVAGGPPPAPLARLPLEIRAGQVFVQPVAAS